MALVNATGTNEISQQISGRLDHSNGGTAGIEQLFVVLAVITILGVLAGAVGRACAGRHLTGDPRYDKQGWVDQRCASCIDGDIETGEEKPPEEAAAEPPPAAAEAPPPAEGGADAAAPPPEGGEAPAPPPEGGGEAAPGGG